MLKIPLLLCVLGSVISAQQTGDSNRNYTVNGIGLNGTSFVTSTIGNTMANVYSTLDGNAPIIWAYSTAGQIGAFGAPGNSVDLNLAGLVFLLDATGLTPGNPFTQFAYTTSSGTFFLTVPVPATLIGQTGYYAMAHTSPMSPIGIFISQTHAVTFVNPANTACTPGGTLVSAGDDVTTQVALSNNPAVSFNFFGVAQTQAFICSNGFTTFGVGETAYIESVANFLIGAPKVCLMWDDLINLPALGGTISYFTDNVGSFEVCYTNVPEYNAGAGAGANTMKLTFINNTSVTMDFAGNMTMIDGICGLTPGMNATGFPLNLSAFGTPIPAGNAPYELFNAVSPIDVKGIRIIWTLDGTGTPINQN